MAVESAVKIGKKVSPSSRRAWIEMQRHISMWMVQLVALLAEGVDRNCITTTWAASLSSVALLAEGVDRNLIAAGKLGENGKSPSSRRAWIEIG